MFKLPPKETFLKQMKNLQFNTYENQFGKYAVPNYQGWLNPGGIGYTLMKGKVWEPKTIKFIQQNINNKSIVHCGAYIGDMLPALSKSTSATVYAFEPHPVSFFCAEKTTIMNNLKNVNLSNIGLGSKEEILDFVYEYNNGQSLAGGSRLINAIQKRKKLLPEQKYKNLQNGKTIKVKINTLDSIIQDEVGIIHYDIEGYEIDAMQGSLRLIKKYKPIIILENIKNDNMFIQKELLPLGYKQVFSAEQNIVWRVE